MWAHTALFALDATAARAAELLPLMVGLCWVGRCAPDSNDAVGAASIAIAQHVHYDRELLQAQLAASAASSWHYSSQGLRWRHNSSQLGPCCGCPALSTLPVGVDRPAALKLPEQLVYLLCTPARGCANCQWVLLLVLSASMLEKERKLTLLLRDHRVDTCHRWPCRQRKSSKTCQHHLQHPCSRVVGSLPVLQHCVVFRVKLAEPQHSAS